MSEIPDLEDTPFAAGDGVLTSSFITTIASLGGGPIFGTLSGDPDITTSGQSFKQDFGFAGYTNYRPLAASGYDYAKFLIQAIRQALTHTQTPRGNWDSNGVKTLRQAVIGVLKSTTFSGVTGNHAFDANGDSTNKTVTVYQISSQSGQPLQLLDCNYSQSCFKAG